MSRPFPKLRRTKMVPRTSKIRCRRGYSLVDIMISIFVLLVAFIGTSNFRYYSTLDAQKATAKITAARIGLMLCESWRGVKGTETYDPTAHFGSTLTITQSIAGPDKPEDFTLLGNYTVTLNGANYYMTLSWKDVSTGLRALNIVVAWAQREQGTSSLNDADKTFKLTTYAL